MAGARSPVSAERFSPELALVRALESCPIDATEVEQLSERVEFDALEKSLTRLRLLALFGQRLTNILGASFLPAAFAGAVKETVEAGRSSALVMQMLTWRLLAALSEAGIVAMPLKGPFLSERLYGDAALRSSTDIDLLVPVADLDRALLALEGAGCRRVRRGRYAPPAASRARAA